MVTAVEQLQKDLFGQSPNDYGNPIALVHMAQAIDAASAGSLEINQGTLTISPTSTLTIGNNLTLTQIGTGAAQVDASPGGGAPTIIGEISGTVASTGTITFEGVGVSGTTPSGIVNMATIVGADANSTAAGVSIHLTAGNASTAQAAGTFYGAGGYGATGHAGGPALLSGGQDRGAGAGFTTLLGGNSYTPGYASGGINLTPGSTSGVTGDADGGNVFINLSTGAGTGKTSQLVVQNDSSLIVAKERWYAGQDPGGAAIFTSTRAMIITAVIVRINAANGTAATLVAAKAASTVAPASGTHFTSNTADLTAAANANQTLALSTTLADITLAAGDSIVLISTGSLAASAGCITIWGTPQ